MSMHRLLSGFILCIVLSSVLVSASFGIAFPPFTEEEPLQLAPGDEVAVIFTVVNAVPGSREPITVTATVNGDEGVAQLIEPQATYTVLPAQIAEIPVLVQAPDDAALGELFTVGLAIREASGESSDTVAFAQTLQASFPLEITDVSTAPPAAVTYDAETLRVAEERLQVGVSLWWIAVFLIIGLALVVGVLIRQTLIKRNRDTPAPLPSELTVNFRGDTPF